MKPLTKTQIRAKAVRTYNEIKAGKIDGVKIYKPKALKVGSITFITE